MLKYNILKCYIVVNTKGKRKNIFYVIRNLLYLQVTKDIIKMFPFSEKSIP